MGFEKTSTVVQQLGGAIVALYWPLWVGRWLYPVSLDNRVCSGGGGPADAGFRLAVPGRFKVLRWVSPGRTREVQGPPLGFAWPYQGGSRSSAGFLRAVPGRFKVLRLGWLVPDGSRSSVWVRLDVVFFLLGEARPRAGYLGGAVRGAV